MPVNRSGLRNLGGALICTALLLGSQTSCTSHIKTLRATPVEIPTEGDNPYLAQAYFEYLQALDQERKGELKSALEHLQQALVYDPTSYQAMTQAAQILEQMGNNDEALVMAQKAIELEPDYVPALTQLSHLYAYEGSFEAAKEVLEHAIQLDPEKQDLYLDLARIHRRDGDRKAALDTLDDYATRTTRVSVYQMSLKAIILKEMERYDDAENAYFDLLSTYPWAEQARLELLSLLVETHGKDYAATRLEELLVAEPWQDWIPPVLVELYVSLGNTEALEKQLELLEKRQNNYDLRFEAIQTLTFSGKFEASERLLAPTLELSGEDRDTAQFLYASLALAQDHYDTAATRFQAVIPSSEHFVPSLIRRAFCLGELGRIDEAIEEIKVFLDTHKNSTDTLYALGLILQDAGRYEESLETLDSLLKLQPENVEAQAQRAGALQQLGRTDEAIRDLEAAMELAPSDFRLYRLLAAIYADERRFEEAIDTLELGLASSPNSFELRYALAVSLDQAGRKHEAIANMKILQQIYPDDPDILNFIGYTYAELGERLSEAEMMIRQALESDPNNGYITDSLGWIFFKQAEYTKAVETLERAVTLSQQDPIILEHLADAYSKVGRQPEALTLLHFSLEALSKQTIANPADIERIINKIEVLDAKNTVKIPAPILSIQ